MLEIISGLLSSSGLGAIVGIAGSWLTKREERKSAQLKYDHDRHMANIRVKEFELEASHELAIADKQIQRSETEGNIAIDLKETDAFTESLKSMSKSTGIKFVDGIRGMMRPLITIYVLILSTIISMEIGTLIGGLDTIPQGKLISMYRYIIEQLIFLTTVAVTWWFGTRPGNRK